MLYVVSVTPSKARHSVRFRHSNAEDLTNMLRGWGVSETAIQEVLGKVRDTHYELACRDLFKAKHPGNEGEEMGNHPMQFYQESVRFYLAKEKPVRGERAERARSYPASSQLQRTVSTVLAGQARLYRWRKLCFSNWYFLVC